MGAPFFIVGFIAFAVIFATRYFRRPVTRSRETRQFTQPQQNTDEPKVVAESNSGVSPIHLLETPLRDLPESIKTHEPSGIAQERMQFVPAPSEMEESEAAVAKPEPDEEAPEELEPPVLETRRVQFEHPQLNGFETKNAFFESQPSAKEPHPSPVVTSSTNGETKKSDEISDLPLVDSPAEEVEPVQDTDNGLQFADLQRGEQETKGRSTEPPHTSAVSAPIEAPSISQSFAMEDPEQVAAKGAAATEQLSTEDDVEFTEEDTSVSTVNPSEHHVGPNGKPKVRRDVRERIGPPGKYRPTKRVPPTPREKRTDTRIESSQVRSLGVDIRLILEPGGFCRLSFLPRRSEQLPKEITVTSFDGSTVDLFALQQEWYEDLIFPHAGALLHSGISWEWRSSDGDPIRWLLSGREIFVLGSHEELSAFVSRPRLVLGDKQIVICVAERQEDVIRAISATGSPQPQILDQQSGMPQGWIALIGVIPRSPVTPSTSGDILDVLCPLPDLQIIFEGGVRIDRSTWLVGHPPVIRTVGEMSGTRPSIDGVEADVDASGALKVEGWDRLGEHNVWCISQNRSYVIREGLEEWEAWDAYRWSLGEFSSSEDTGSAAICGALVRKEFGSASAKPIFVPASNPILIGAVPGEIFYCQVRSDCPAKVAMGFPPFEPVWALPSDPLHCDKNNSRILLMGAERMVEPLTIRGVPRESGRNREVLRRIRAWYTFVLEASRKRILLSPEGTQSLWRSYKTEANRLRRSWK